MEIRKALLDDVPELINLWIEFMDFHAALDSDFVRSDDAADNWARFINAKFDDNDFRIFVAENVDALVGYVIATVNEYPPIRTLTRYGFVTDMAVTEKYRRRGIARKLFKEAEQWLLSVGVLRIELKVDTLNDTSRAFWKNEGFAVHTETLIKKY